MPRRPKGDERFLQIQIDRRELERLRRLARRTDRSMSQIARDAIRRAIEEARR